MIILSGVKAEIIMTKLKTKKVKSTFEKIMEAKTPVEKKEYDEGYRDFILSEMILAAMEDDNVSVRKLAKIAGVSPTIVQDMKSGAKTSFNTNSLFKILQGLGYDVLLERNGVVTSLGLAAQHKK
jgi:hypothetical protein